MPRKPFPHSQKKHSKRSPKKSSKQFPDLVYGKNPVYELIKAQSRKVHEALLAEPSAQWQKDPLFQLIKQNSTPHRFVDRSELDYLSHDGVHQGVLARVGPFPEHFLDDLPDTEDAQLVLVLDSVKDPQNFGTLCRSALAFGCEHVVVAQDRSSPVTPVVCKASAGAIEHVKVMKVTNLVRALEALKEKGYWVYGASLDEASQDVAAIDPAQKVALVLGDEGKGLRRLVAEHCDVLVKIPMAAGWDSLNVAQAGTVLLYKFSKI